MLAGMENRIPPRLVSGDTIDWLLAAPAYPASAGWQLSVRLVGPALITLGSTPDGDMHRITVSATASSAYAAGLYRTHTVVEHTDGRRHSLDSGQIKILANPAAATPGDARSPAQKTLDELKAAYSQYLSTSGHIAEYEIGGAINRKFKFRSASEIIAQIEFWQREVAKEADADSMAAGHRPRRRLLVRF